MDHESIVILKCLTLKNQETWLRDENKRKIGKAKFFIPKNMISK